MKKPDKRQLKMVAYTAAQWTWGLPQTLAGAALFLKHRQYDHFEYRGARATVWDKDTGVSLGKFIFVPRRRSARAAAATPAGTHPANKVDPFLLDHEYGHTLQSLILGPFYLLAIGAPSMLWNRLPYFQRKRKQSGRSYYSAPFEKTANILAAKVRSRSE